MMTEKFVDPAKTIPESSVILRAEVGSGLYGLKVVDNTPCNYQPIMSRICEKGTGGCTVKHSILGDRDELGICVESFEMGIGFTEFDQYVFRTATERTGIHDAPSEPGDLDLTIYSLKKFLRLALKGNPTIIQLLFIPQDKWVSGDARGSGLQELAPLLISKDAGFAFLGYLQAQRQRMLGERGGTHGRAHSEDKANFGYDTKYSTHMLRLGYQAIELITTGVITFPMPESQRQELLSVRRGLSSAQKVLTRAGELEREVKDLLATCPLREHADRVKVEQWMLKTYWGSWNVGYGKRYQEEYRGMVRKFTDKAGKSWKDREDQLLEETTGMTKDEREWLG